jgi:hypothetical protein
MLTVLNDGRNTYAPPFPTHTRPHIHTNIHTHTHTGALVQIAPVVDASSSQSRTDVLGIGLSAVLLLTGLQWLSLKPREQFPVRAFLAARLPSPLLHCGKLWTSRRVQIRDKQGRDETDRGEIMRWN